MPLTCSHEVGNIPGLQSFPGIRAYKLNSITWSHCTCDSDSSSDLRASFLHVCFPPSSQTRGIPVLPKVNTWTYVLAIVNCQPLLFSKVLTGPPIIPSFTLKESRAQVAAVGATLERKVIIAVSLDVPQQTYNLRTPFSEGHDPNMVPLILIHPPLLLGKMRMGWQWDGKAGKEEMVRKRHKACTIVDSCHRGWACISSISVKSPINFYWSCYKRDL